ncbi:ATP-binding cassette domain-containing protein [Pseudomonas sp. Hp2]|uniref:ATP-binding cassette domain-containing protein n=1 Tax=Pseudomonas sp. Hp2 TaxID=701189 RepID=UPI00112C3DCF|nr:ATP-binding cassette domain-containing protein [Pseudomonas sp. Hp2]
MQVPSLTLDGVAFHLADGRCLFSDIHLHLDATPTGLVGRNGVGKSVLARILAGQLAPSRGRRSAQGRVRYLPQQVAVAAGASVADLAGMGPVVAALARIEAGSADPADFEAVGERWDIRRELATALRMQDLPEWEPGHPAALLSGGEAMRVALAGAWLAGADLLILDEPSNHLDRAQRERLRRRLADWPGGLLVVSHDRTLLEDMRQIVELSPQGLRCHGGGYGAYAEAAARASAAAQAELDRQRAGLRRVERERQQAHQRMQRRQARGRQEGHEANQAPILLGLSKSRSEASQGRQQALQDRALAQQRDAVREAASQAPPERPVVLWPPRPLQRRRTAVLQGARLPFGPHAAHPLDLVLEAGRRIAVCGGNGRGKSTLLRMLAGRLMPAEGTCEVPVARAWLDQYLGGIDARLAPLSLLRDANPALPEADLWLRLVLLGLAAEALERPCASLSGGERLKVALACAIYAAEPAELLLLDEPANHLDLPSRQALEAMLQDYPGTLVVVSHDEALLERLALDGRLDLDRERPRLEPW